MNASLVFSDPEIDLGFTFANLRLEPDGTLFQGDDSIHLAPKELAALRVLLANPGRIVTPAQLKEALWPDVHVTADSVPRCISSLRSRLGDAVQIRTIYKRGYRFDSPVHRHASAPQNTLPRLVVVPFEVGMCVPEHLGSAIAEEAGLHLIELQPAVLRVLARDSIFTLAARGFTAGEIGHKMNADLVLSGCLQSSTMYLRLRVEMTRVSDGLQLWAEDVLAPRHRPAILERRLLLRLASRLGGQLPVDPSASAAEVVNDDARAAAYETFLAGREESRSPDQHRLQNAAALLSKAADQDPDLLAARRQIVTLSVNQCLYGYEAPASAAEQIRRIAEAIPEKGQAAEAILPALGWTLFHIEHKLAFALRMLNNRTLTRRGSPCAFLHAMLALSRWQFEEAHILLSAALRDNPYSPSLHALSAWSHHLAGNGPESLDQAEQGLALFPGDERAELTAALILAFNGNPSRAVELAHQVAQRRPSLDVALAIEAYALARSRRVRDAKTILERLQWLGRERYVMTSFTAATYAELGEIDGAIAELEAAETARCPWFFQTLADPRLQRLHEDPRFERMRRLLQPLEDSVETQAACMA